MIRKSNDGGWICSLSPQGYERALAWAIEHETKNTDSGHGEGDRDAPYDGSVPYTRKGFIFEYGMNEALGLEQRPIRDRPQPEPDAYLLVRGQIRPIDWKVVGWSKPPYVGKKAFRSLPDAIVVFLRAENEDRWAQIVGGIDMSEFARGGPLEDAARKGTADKNLVLTWDDITYSPEEILDQFIRHDA